MEIEEQIMHEQETNRLKAEISFYQQQLASRDKCVDRLINEKAQIICDKAILLAEIAGVAAVLGLCATLEQPQKFIKESEENLYKLIKKYTYVIE